MKDLVAAAECVDEVDPHPEQLGHVLGGQEAISSDHRSAPRGKGATPLSGILRRLDTPVLVFLKRCFDVFEEFEHVR